MAIKPSRKLTRVLVYIGWTAEYRRLLMRGVQSFADTQQGWELINGGLPVGEAYRWQPHGIIGILDWLPKITENFARYNVPIVSLFDYRFRATINIYNDNETVGRLAAQYFLDRHYHHFAFLGMQSHPESIIRERGFVNALKNAGQLCHVKRISDRENQRILNHTWSPINRSLIKWLDALRKPVAVLCGNDITARWFMESCREQFRIPEEVAVLGIDNDELWCETSRPQLSSVIIPWQTIGYTAAQWLSKLMAGRKPPGDCKVFVPPVGIQTRQSSDITAVDDLDMAAALNFIQHHACDPISVHDVLTEVPLDRRRLERFFQNKLGRTPHDEIRRVQLERAKYLLAKTDLTINQVAARCGIYPQNFARVFHQTIGQKPSEYRNLFRPDQTG